MHTSICHAATCCHSLLSHTQWQLRNALKYPGKGNVTITWSMSAAATAYSICKGDKD